MRRYNPGFGKISDGKFEYASNPLVIDGTNFSTNNKELFKIAGYYPIVYTEKPVKSGCYYLPDFAQEGEIIKQIWEEHEIPSEEEGG